jgi:histidinol dehydrogenase
MRRFDLSTEGTLEKLLHLFDSRLNAATDAAEDTVREILADVRVRGDDAVLARTRQFDCAHATLLRVPAAATDAAVARIQETDLWPALSTAAQRIRDFHERQCRQSWFMPGAQGEILGQLIRPLERVGLYVPGGQAAYPSTVLMIGIPATVAGVGTIALATPPARETGVPPDATLAAARLAGISEIYAMGGAQAIGALAYGTASVRRVDMIAGPGNVYANLAKKFVYGTVGIDMLAGPSEVAVLADATADIGTVAADLIAQTEHDPHNAALLVSPADDVIDRVLAAIEHQLQDLPRAETVRMALGRNGLAVRTATLTEAVAVINAYAPEHLHVDTVDPWSLLPTLHRAGAILLGRHSGAAHGDYVAGPSHTLPTAGCARFASPVSVDDFVKRQSIVALSADAAASLAPIAAVIGRYEGLEGHARAAERHKIGL